MSNHLTAAEWQALEQDPRVTIHGSYLDAESGCDQ